MTNHDEWIPERTTTGPISVELRKTQARNALREALLKTLGPIEGKKADAAIDHIEIKGDKYVVVAKATKDFSSDSLVRLGLKKGIDFKGRPREAYGIPQKEYTINQKVLDQVLHLTAEGHGAGLDR